MRTRRRLELGQPCSHNSQWPHQEKKCINKLLKLCWIWQTRAGCVNIFPNDVSPNTDKKVSYRE